MAVDAGRFGAGIEGLRDFISDLRAVDRELPRVVTRVHREFATEVRDTARGIANRMPGKHRFAALIDASASQRSGDLRYRATDHDAAAGWLFGAKKHRQFLRWVGNRHQKGYGDFGSRVHAIGPAIEKETPRIVDQYHDRVVAAFRKAFPK